MSNVEQVTRHHRTAVGHVRLKPPKGMSGEAEDAVFTHNDLCGLDDRRSIQDFVQRHIGRCCVADVGLEPPAVLAVVT